jgi:hypothetical protein
MMGIVVVLKTPLWCYYDSSADIVVVLEYLFKIRYFCRLAVWRREFYVAKL